MYQAGLKVHPQSGVRSVSLRMSNLVRGGGGLHSATTGNSTVARIVINKPFGMGKFYHKRL